MSTHAAQPHSTPTFIISCERSGSTLLRYIVDTHPEIASPGELHLGQLCRDLRRVVERTTAAVAEVSDEAARQQLVLNEVRRIVGEQMDSYARAKGKRLWCEKTTMNLDYLDDLSAVFPDARYICLYRNAMDVIHSCIENSRWGAMPEHVEYIHKYPRNTVAALVERWTEKTRALAEFERNHAGQCFRLRYESLVRDPASDLAPLFEFLGVAWDEQLIDKIFATQHDQGDGDTKVRFASKIHDQSIGQGSMISASFIPANLLNEMNAVLSELDYPIVGPDWDHTPSPYRSAAVSSAPAQPTQQQLEVADVFNHYLPQRLSVPTAELPDHGVIYKVVITGDEGGTWRIDLTQPYPQISAGDGEAHCTITMTSQDLVDMISGKLNPAAAWMQGKLHVGGDLSKAQNFGQLLFA